MTATAPSADVVVDPVFGWVAEATLDAMAPGGRLVNLGGSASDLTSFMSADVRGRGLSLPGYTNNALSPDQRAEALLHLADLAAAGRVGVAHETRRLSEAAEVWRSQRSGASGVRQVPCRSRAERAVRRSASPGSATTG